jgi:hypothetical protein
MRHMKGGFTFRGVIAWEGVGRELLLTFLPFLVGGLAAAVLFVAAPAQAVDTEDGFWRRPSVWAPSVAEAQMGYETWGNVAYFFRWDLSRIPTALLAWENKDASDAESLELGWKRTGGDDCN